MELNIKDALENILCNIERVFTNNSLWNASIPSEQEMIQQGDLQELLKTPLNKWNADQLRWLLSNAD